MNFDIKFWMSRERGVSGAIYGRLLLILFSSGLLGSSCPAPAPAVNPTLQIQLDGGDGGLEEGGGGAGTRANPRRTRLVFRVTVIGQSRCNSHASHT